MTLGERWKWGSTLLRSNEYYFMRQRRRASPAALRPSACLHLFHHAADSACQPKPHDVLRGGPKAVNFIMLRDPRALAP